MYMCIYMIVSCKFIHAHIAFVSSYVLILHLYVRYDYVQYCEDTVSVELRYIN